MNLKSAFTSVLPAFGMMDMTADRTRLTCIGRGYILNLDACSSGFVFYKLCESVE